jgi:hypothetical protein
MSMMIGRWTTVLLLVSLAATRAAGAIARHGAVFSLSSDSKNH